MKPSLTQGLLVAGLVIILFAWGFSSMEEEGSAAAATIAQEMGDEVVSVEWVFSNKCSIGTDETLGTPYRVTFKHERPMTLCCSGTGCLPSPYVETVPRPKSRRT